MPTTQAEWEVHWAVYQLTLKQRDAAWREVKQLQAELDAVRSKLRYRQLL